MGRGQSHLHGRPTPEGPGRALPPTGAWATRCGQDVSRVTGTFGTRGEGQRGDAVSSGVLVIECGWTTRGHRGWSDEGTGGSWCDLDPCDTCHQPRRSRLKRTAAGAASTMLAWSEARDSAPSPAPNTCQYPERGSVSDPKGRRTGSSLWSRVTNAHIRTSSTRTPGFPQPSSPSLALTVFSTGQHAWFRALQLGHWAHVGAAPTRLREPVLARAVWE